MAKYDIGGLLVRLGGVFGALSRHCHRVGFRMQADVKYMIGRTR